MNAGRTTGPECGRLGHSNARPTENPRLFMARRTPHVAAPEAGALRLLLLWVMLLLWAGPACLAASRGLPARYGIVNYDHLNDHLYRGAAPGSEGIDSLKKLGVQWIIDLRQPQEIKNGEAKLAAAAGLTYTNFPLDGLHAPTSNQVYAVLALISNAPGPVFIHCEHGCDRTGTIVACYQIARDHKTPAEALAEAKKHGISPLEVGMKNFITHFQQPARKPPKTTKGS